MLVGARKLARLEPVVRLRRRWRRTREDLYIWAAATYRRCLTGPTAVAITGSCGKTTATNLIGAILARRGNGLVSEGGRHWEPVFARRVLAIRPWHRHFVQEVSGHGPGAAAVRAHMMRPNIAVVTNVGLDHYKAYRGREGVAESKGDLVEALPDDGVAVLNADDPYVMAMAGRTRARVITFGMVEDADVRGSEIAAAWPDRLSLTLRHGGETRRVRTQLLGEHWANAVLAAAAAGLAAGASLDDCVAGLADAEPAPGRMCPHELPGGAVIIDDSFKAPHWTMPTAIRFMETARARRKTFVIGTISDYAGSRAPKYRAVAQAALAVADRVCFVGPNSQALRKDAIGEYEGRLLLFANAKAIADHLSGNLQAGDLVLVKGSEGDHLERVLLHLTSGVRCWREKCGRPYRCDTCELQFVPSAPPDADGG